MKKYVRNSVLFYSLLAVGTSSLVKADEFADYAASMQRFGELQAQAARRRSMPMLSDPEAAKVLAALSDHRRFLEAQPFTEGDLHNLMDICDGANRAARSFVAFDPESSLNKTFKDPAETASITAAVALRNIVKYQDEIFPLLAFEVKCFAKEIPLLERFFAKLAPAELTAERRAGLAQARNGMFTVFIGSAQVPFDAAISMRNRRELISAAAEAAPSFARVLDPAARRRAHEHFAAQASRVPPQLAGAYRQLVNALNETECTALCRL